MKDFFKKNWFLSLIGLFMLVNIVLVAYNFVITKQKKNEYQKLINELKQGIQLSNRRQFVPNTNINFYDLPCPEISKYSISGEKIDLHNLIGNVILIRFSRFYKQDLANLVYLQHLADKYRNQSVSLIFINTLGKHDEETISEIINLTSPIIEDDGSIVARFNAYLEDFIIVDRDFNIKFKHHRGSKTVIYNEVIKWIFKELPRYNHTSKYDVSNIIQKLTYYDVYKNRIQKVIQQKYKKICLTTLTSICTGCEEDLRMLHLKELSNEVDINRVKILVLFGKGNTIEAIKQYAISSNWDKFPISIGVMNDSSELTESEYYQIFPLDTDPWTLIINSARDLAFSETRKTTKMINSEFLKEKLK